MYHAIHFWKEDAETFCMELPVNKEFKILQLTDLHLGFGIFSRKKDEQAMQAVCETIKKTSPDLMILTGDSIFPFLPKAGTRDNRKQTKKLTAFLDSFQIPYALVFGNHDSEMGAKCGKDELAELFTTGKYAIFAKGREEIFGVGNYFINLVDQSKRPQLSLALLDSNMYGDGWFYSGFDCIHEDQTEWCMGRLNQFKTQNKELEALAFFHIPPTEFKEAYEKMKLGDTSVTYHFGSVAEKDEYFGIPKERGSFFAKAVDNGMIKGMFCGHDHLNTVSLTYQGIRLTYGMSIDCLGYRGIDKQYTQRGGTLITRKADGQLEIRPVPYDRVVSKKVSGVKEK